jgi:hypothetical protein
LSIYRLKSRRPAPANTGVDFKFCGVRDLPLDGDEQWVAARFGYVLGRGSPAGFQQGRFFLMSGNHLVCSHFMLSSASYGLRTCARMKMKMLAADALAAILLHASLLRFSHFFEGFSWVIVQIG